MQSKELCSRQYFFSMYFSVFLRCISAHTFYAGGLVGASYQSICISKVVGFHSNSLLSARQTFPFFFDALFTLSSFSNFFSLLHSLLLAHFH